MFKKELIIGVIATSVLLGSFGSALAEDSNATSILGIDEFTFETTDTTSDAAARNYVYDQEQLAVVGTEAGDWEFRSYDQVTATSEAVANKQCTIHNNS